MDDYEVTFAKSATKELESLSASLIERVLRRINCLANDPRPVGSRKLSGSTSLYRLRIGDYRVIYDIDDRRKIVDISAVRHRRDAYR